MGFWREGKGQAGRRAVTLTSDGILGPVPARRPDDERRSGPARIPLKSTATEPETFRGRTQESLRRSHFSGGRSDDLKPRQGLRRPGASRLDSGARSPCHADNRTARSRQTTIPVAGDLRATSGRRRETTTSCPVAGNRAEAVLRRHQAGASAPPASAASAAVQPRPDRAWLGPSPG